MHISGFAHLSFQTVASSQNRNDQCRCRCRILEDLHITRVRTPSSSLVTSISRESTISRTAQPTPLTDLLNSESRSPVSPCSPPSLSLFDTVCCLRRAIHVPHTTIRIEPLSSFCASASTSKLCRSDHNRTWSATGFVCRVGDAVSTTHSTRREPCPASKDNQRSDAFRWQRLLFVCI